MSATTIQPSQVESPGELSAGKAAASDNSQPGGFSELVDLYAVAEHLPPAEWVTRLNLVRPRRDVRCLNWSTRCIKRAMDAFVAATMLIVLSPLLLVVALLVKLTSRGPVVFQQTRVGLNLRAKASSDRRVRNLGAPDGNERRSGDDRRLDSQYGKPFVLFKFRTMRTDAEKNGAQFATKGDPRVTPIGRFLRKSRIDELPQLWNVLRGEMTLVGPRPERPEFIEKLSDEIPNYLERLGLKPGLTGPAQVINDIESFRRKVALDLLYLQNCCFWNDLKILFRTVGVVFTGKGAL